LEPKSTALPEAPLTVLFWTILAECEKKSCIFTLLLLTGFQQIENALFFEDYAISSSEQTACIAKPI